MLVVLNPVGIISSSSFQRVKNVQKNFGGTHRHFFIGPLPGAVVVVSHNAQAPIKHFDTLRSVGRQVAGKGGGGWQA